MKNQRINWVDYAKGICIFAVVTLYAAISVEKILGDAGWMQYWVDFARPFRMPDFFLISGLFLARVIDRPWLNFIDKKIIHYCYFFALWTGINIVIYFVVEDRAFTPPALVRSYWSAISSWPFKMLWFIQMLPAYFLFTRLLKKVPKPIVLIVAVLLQCFPLFHTSRAIIDEFWVRYVYFFIGYAYASSIFCFAEYVERHKSQARLGFVAWVIVNSFLVFLDYAELPFISTALGVLGAMAVVVAAVLINNVRWLRFFRYLGENSIVVYLAFYWPMMGVISLCLKAALPSAFNGTLTLIATLGGILSSVALFELTKRMRITRALFERPAWAMLNTWKDLCRTLLMTRLGIKR